jgi:hypothetical protein
MAPQPEPDRLVGSTMTDGMPVNNVERKSIKALRNRRLTESLHITERSTFPW